MFKKLKEKKGFTLVELIVVLVILAILAALLIPALTGYIDKAKNKSIVADTRQAVMAAQTLVDEKYAKNDVGVAVTVGDDKDVTYAAVKNLSEVTGEIKSIELNTTKSGDNEIGTKVVKLVYVKGNKKCTYDPNATDKSGFSDGDYNVERYTAGK